jgi:hypothetical protein
MPLLAELAAFLRYGSYKDFAPSGAGRPFRFTVAIEISLLSSCSLLRISRDPDNRLVFAL